MTIRQQLLLKALAVAPILAMGTWLVFITLCSSMILLRNVQAGKQQLDLSTFEELTVAATQTFEIKEQYEVLEILEQHQHYRQMAAVLRKMIEDQADRLTLRLQLADALAADGQFTEAHEHYELILQQLNR